MKKISISEAYNFKIGNIPVDFKSKEEFVLFWLIEFRKYLLENKIGDFGDIIPSKKDISKLLKVSQGTIQNAVKMAEDRSYFTSKQCIGTMIKDTKIKLEEFKMVSKKDRAITQIKKYLYQQGYKKGDVLPSIMELSRTIKTSTNTVRLALFELILKQVLKKDYIGKKPVFTIVDEIKLSEKEKSSSFEVKNKNLVKIVKENIRKYLSKNYQTGKKIPTNAFFAKMYNVSIRTVNLAIKELNKEKTVISRRGAYGSIFLNSGIKDLRSEKSIFMSAPKSKKEIVPKYNYKWENILENIKTYIQKNHEAGDKIPSMKDCAKIFNVSVSTVKKAISQLSLQGVLYTQKGKYGGIFIVEMPQSDDKYRWLSINPDYFEKTDKYRTY